MMIHLDTKSGGLAGFMREDSWAPRVADSSAAGACRVFHNSIPHFDYIITVLGLVGAYLLSTMLVSYMPLAHY